jgi:hypothetical protein
MMGLLAGCTNIVSQSILTAVFCYSFSSPASLYLWFSCSTYLVMAAPSWSTTRSQPFSTSAWKTYTFKKLSATPRFSDWEQETSMNPMQQSRYDPSYIWRCGLRSSRSKGDELRMRSHLSSLLRCSVRSEQVVHNHDHPPASNG